MLSLLSKQPALCRCRITSSTRRKCVELGNVMTALK